MPRYAVNVCDIAHPELAIPNMCLLAGITSRETVQLAKLDEALAVLNEGIAPERVDAIRQVYQLKGWRVRFYQQGKRGGWSMLKS